MYASNTFTSTFNQNHDFHHAEVERMFEAVNKKCFGYTVEDVLRKLEASRGDGQKGKFLQQVTEFILIFSFFIVFGASGTRANSSAGQYSQKASM